MNVHKIKITTPGHFIIFAGKKIRTPVVFEKISDQDLLLLKNQIRQQNLKYILDDQESLVDIKLKEKITNIEELYAGSDENKSTLKKLLEKWIERNKCER